MSRSYDFVVLGGGHNGLLTTIYLAKAGFSVCCLEANKEFGGGTRSGEVTAPGYISDLGGMVHNMISKTPIVKQDELELLSKYGLKYSNADYLFCSIFPDNSSLIMYKDMDKFCQNIAQFSEKDAETYPKFHAYMTKMLQVAGVGSQTPPPRYGAMQNIMYMSPEGREFQRVLNSSAQQIVEEWFESEEVRVTFTRWCTEMMIDPRAIGTATLLYFTSTVHKDDYFPLFPTGGSITFVNALCDCAKDHGADLFTEQYVDKIICENGEVKSVQTKAGEEFCAKEAVISTICIKHVYDMLGEQAPADEAQAIRRLKQADFSALNQSFALKKIPEFKAGPEILKTFCIEAAPHEKEYLETFSNYKLGGFKPNLPLITMPSLFDSSRVPNPEHSVVNLYSYAPYNLWGDPNNWDTHKDELAYQVWEHFKSMTTNISDEDIIGKWCLSPKDYEVWDPAFERGDIGMIGLQPSQMYDMRPLVGKGHQYHGAIENLYFLGACSHPGGGIAAGARAGVQRVLEDYDIDFRDVVRKS